MKHKVKRVHFVGIGGAGMSGIAEVLLNLGYQVSGSDLTETAVTARLRAQGANVFRGHDATQVEGADAVVISTAVRPDNPEVAAARARRIPVVPRAIMLAELMRLRQGIAIAGTHGKTTTTSLIASVLAEAGMDPTFVIGGRLEAAGSHAKLGKGEFIVVEADESDASFLNLQPVLAVVTNIDADHMETYGHDFGRLRQAFLDFLQRLPFYGMAVLCLDDANVRALLPLMSKPVTTYGVSEQAQIRAVDIRHEGGRMRFRAEIKANGNPAKTLDVVLNLPGTHNVLNALAAIAIGLEVQVPDDAIVRALAEFKGVGRRFQRYGEIPLAAGGDFTLIDDYGHHPAEMEATLAAVRGAFPGRRLVLAFQPHRYTRTRDVFEDFVRVLSTVDALLLTEVYPAGEAPIVAADGRALARAIRVAGKVEPVFIEQVSELPQAILDLARSQDVVVTMGAGSIGAVPGAVANRNNSTPTTAQGETHGHG
jgi:UDP-N-acetylmuramate--alanine ligase